MLNPDATAAGPAQGIRGVHAQGQEPGGAHKKPRVSAVSCVRRRTGPGRKMVVTGGIEPPT